MLCNALLHERVISSVRPNAAALTLQCATSTALNGSSPNMQLLVGVNQPRGCMTYSNNHPARPLFVVIWRYSERMRKWCRSDGINL